MPSEFVGNIYEIAMFGSCQVTVETLTCNIYHVKNYGYSD